MIKSQKNRILFSMLIVLFISVMGAQEYISRLPRVINVESNSQNVFSHSLYSDWQIIKNSLAGESFFLQSFTLSYLPNGDIKNLSIVITTANKNENVFYNIDYNKISSSYKITNHIGKSSTYEGKLDMERFLTLLNNKLIQDITPLTTSDYIEIRLDGMISGIKGKEIAPQFYQVTENQHDQEIAGFIFEVAAMYKQKNSNESTYGIPHSYVLKL